MPGLLERFLSGDSRALARLATLIEANDPDAEAALTELYSRTGLAHVVGITGPPGAGKSTLVNALIGAARGRGRRVAVIAVDPSSPISGGAVLGDRIRMMERHSDNGVFIRSMATRGRVGGLAIATAGIVHLLDAAAYPLILIETVGAGQDGVDIADLAQTVVVLQVPGLGDGVQAIKAGVLEIADIFVVNKADLPDANELVRLLRSSTSPTANAQEVWRRPVLPVVSTSGDGIDSLLDHIDDHRAYLNQSGEGQRRNRKAAQAEILARLRSAIEQRLSLSPDHLPALNRGIDDAAARRVAPHEVVASFLASIGAR